MKILANENFPGEAVEALRARGHDVAWIRTDAPGVSDEQVIRRAAAEGRLLITFDRDFGALAFRSRLPAPSGIILFRMAASSPSFVAQTSVALIEARSDWAGHFSVVGADRLRMTPLPSAG
jgi:predicted nuclease of predicted toxin-antitoxin system